MRPSAAASAWVVDRSGVQLLEWVVVSVNKTAVIVYRTGEMEELTPLKVANEGHLSLTGMWASWHLRVCMLYIYGSLPWGCRCEA